VTDLYPTKTRLALLRQVANSLVQSGYADDVLLFPDAPTSWEYSRKVTARIEELERAGWVTELHPDHPGCWWVPTEAGYAVLAAADQATP